MHRSRESEPQSGRALIHPGLTHLRTQGIGCTQERDACSLLAVHTPSHIAWRFSSWLCRELVHTPQTLHLDTSRRIQRFFLVVRGGKHRAMLPLTELRSR